MESIQSLILRSDYQDHPVAVRYRHLLKSEFFDQHGGARMLLDALREYQDRYGSSPTFEQLYLRLNDSAGSDDTLKEALDLARQCDAEVNQRPDDQWLDQQYRDFIERAVVTNAIQDVFGADNSEPIAPLVQNALDSLYRIQSALSPRPVVGLSFSAEEADYVFDKFNSPQQRFATMLPVLDDLTAGGLARTQVGVIAAGSGVGKSMAMCALGAEAVKNGASVLYLNCESEDYELQTRIACNLADMSSSDYKKLSREKLQELHRKLSSYKVVVKDLMESARPSDIRNAVEQFRRAMGQCPDVILVDYLNELEPEREGKADTSYGVMGKNMKELLKLAKRTNAVLWTAVQLNREGLKKSKNLADPPDASHISESLGVLFKATLVVLLTLVPEKDAEAGVGHLMLDVLKYRFNAGRPQAVLEIEYPKARMRQLSEADAAAVITAAAVDSAKGKTKNAEVPPTQFNGKPPATPRPAKKRYHLPVFDELKV